MHCALCHTRYNALETLDLLGVCMCLFTLWCALPHRYSQARVCGSGAHVCVCVCVCAEYSVE